LYVCAFREASTEISVLLDVFLFEILEETGGGLEV